MNKQSQQTNRGVVRFDCESGTYWDLTQRREERKGIAKNNDFRAGFSEIAEWQSLFRVKQPFSTCRLGRIVFSMTAILLDFADLANLVSLR